VRPRAAQDHAREALRIHDRDRLADGPAGGHTDQMCALDAERIHQSRNLVRHPVDRKRSLQTVARACPAMRN